MDSVVVLQARTNSTRLPGKVLLSIADLPLVILAAKRAANTGRTVIVVTSKESTDDELARVLSTYGINIFRGSLNNTLQRIVEALSEYNENTLVFRLTGDNTFPDGLLLDEIEAYFLEKELEYLCCNGEQSGLPYGLSVELMRLKHLREALSSASSTFDQEHVTPYIRRKYGENYFVKYKNLSKGHLRCTVDCLDDYLNICRVFAKVEDPIKVSAFKLIQELEGEKGQPYQPQLTQKLVLGTAQLGLDYGIVNKKGKPSSHNARRLIKDAITNGTLFIDTARAYGNSEQLIGDVLSEGWNGRARIITKLSPLNDIEPNASFKFIENQVDKSIYESCASLMVRELDVLLLHRASHLSLFHGVIWKRLLQHKASGLIGSLGVSVQSPSELESALENEQIELIQMPFNILDWRWDKLLPKIVERKLQRKLIIHVRSTLLQGLLTSTDESLWEKALVKEPHIFISWLRETVEYYNQQTVADLCLNYTRSLEWVDGVVIGMENQEQMLMNIKTFTTDFFPEKVINEIVQKRPKISAETLNPSNWCV
ncbi:hypothetical protein E0H88_03385 [Acinetobacter sp. ANC 4216]|uniref:aldo/keto reductase n=1 Tax=Acinetobacter sp. ANC 4216 TaxID=2529840 RepID=UPI001040CE41|nr:aldo/keto reductase [Acinetobacter sp. ANC 4216]RZJ22728.1 MAG: hypothetical protein EON51_06110 [Acinetobacter sp.]TCB72054.1 hypothetical protein E0H88_03385 [Acinetobacter sp. ANC 4216]